MGFNRGGYGSNRGRSSFGGNRGFNNRGSDRPRPTLYKAVCDKCGKECEVPFQPSNGKPVYCRDCYREMGGADARNDRRPEERSFSRPNFENRNTENRNTEHPQYKEQFAAINVKLDKILNILNSAITAEEAPNAAAAKEKETEIIEPKEEVVVKEKKKRTPKKTA